ncbi:hypothetical protein HOD88_01960 [archaeon]|jgi:hypothetical protein|nr:hypothetical protein [archaeon]
MNKWLELLIGLILLVGGIYVWGTNLAGFGMATLSFLKGGIMWGVLFAGLALIILGISDLKE